MTPERQERLVALVERGLEYIQTAGVRFLAEAHPDAINQDQAEDASIACLRGR